MPAQGNMVRRSWITQARLQRHTIDSVQSFRERKIAKFVDMMEAPRTWKEEWGMTMMTGVERPLKVSNSRLRCELPVTELLMS